MTNSDFTSWDQNGVWPELSPHQNWAQAIALTTGKQPASLQITVPGRPHAPNPQLEGVLASFQKTTPLKGHSNCTPRTATGIQNRLQDPLSMYLYNERDEDS